MAIIDLVVTGSSETVRYSGTEMPSEVTEDTLGIAAGQSINVQGPLLLNDTLRLNGTLEIKG